MTNAQTAEDADILAAYQKGKTEGSIPAQDTGISPDAPPAPEPQAPEAKTTETTPATPATPTTLDTAVETKVDVDALIKEKFGKSYEEVVAEIEAAKTPKEIEFKNEKLKKAYEWVEKMGGDLEEFETIHNTNWDKVNDDAILLAKMKKENSNLTDEEVTKLFNYTYKTDADTFSEIDVEMGNLKKKQEAATARIEYKKLQEEAKVPSNYKTAEEQKQRSEAVQKNWEKDVDSSLSSFSKVTEAFKTATGLEVNFEVKPDAAQLKDLKDLLYNPNTLFKDYLNKDGKADLNRLAQDMYLLKNKGKWMKDLVEQTEETFVRTRLKNTDFSQKFQKTSPDASKEEIRRQKATEFFS